jgi:ABC-type multidrug transport system fused ATPase/permease subunit
MAIPARALIDNDILLHVSDTFWIGVMLYPIVLTLVFFVDRHRWAPSRVCPPANNHSRTGAISESQSSLVATGRPPLWSISTLLRGETLDDSSHVGVDDVSQEEMNRIDASTTWLTSWTLQSLRVRGVSVFWAKRVAYLIGYSMAVSILCCFGLRETPFGHQQQQNQQRGREGGSDGSDDRQSEMRLRDNNNNNSSSGGGGDDVSKRESDTHAGTYRKNPLRSSRFRAALLVCTMVVVWGSSLRIEDEFMNGPIDATAISSYVDVNHIEDAEDVVQIKGQNESNNDHSATNGEVTSSPETAEQTEQGPPHNLCPLRRLMPKQHNRHHRQSAHHRQQHPHLHHNTSNSTTTSSELKVYPIHIAFHDVGCSVPSVDAPVLSGVTGEIAPGRLTIILGPSGAGKSLFAGALLGRAASLCSQHTGRIFLNGKERSLALVVDRLG